MTNNKTSYYLPSAVCCLMLTLCIGCTSITPPKTLKGVLRTERPKTPGVMTAFWNSYIQSNPNGDIPLRGVGGRILFYNDKNMAEPIKVDGELTIFLFDATDPLPERSVPVQQAIFKKENFSSFYRKDNQDLHGYEFFVPVDELGNEEMELKVWAVFHEFKKSGKTTALINSAPAVVTLSGPKRGEQFSGDEQESDSGSVITLAGGRDEPNEIVQASYQRPSSTENFDSRSRRVESIQLPTRLAKAWQNEPRDTTSEKVANPYVPQGRQTEAKPQESKQESEMTPGDWLKPPNRLAGVPQPSQTASNNHFRINPPAKPTSNLPVHEEVSPSGRKTQMWVQ